MLLSKSNNVTGAPKCTKSREDRSKEEILGLKLWGEVSSRQEQRPWCRNELGVKGDQGEEREIN